jgi:hypothetical protein
MSRHLRFILFDVDYGGGGTVFHHDRTMNISQMK